MTMIKTTSLKDPETYPRHTDMIECSRILKSISVSTLKISNNFSYQTDSQSLYRIISLYFNLISYCISSRSLKLGETIHARLLKLGFNHFTFLGNGLINLYTEFRLRDSALRSFQEIYVKNCTSWNILLMGYVKADLMHFARQLFDEMPIRDVVTWNSMITGYSLRGHSSYALELFCQMHKTSIQPSEFTFSIVTSCASSLTQVKQVHGHIIKRYMNLSNTVIGNSLIDMYGKFGLVDYAFFVFMSMEILDFISWNSMILGFGRSGYGELALTHFNSMRALGFPPDHFTFSTVITVCSDLNDVEKGKQLFGLCTKLGFLCHSIVSSAIIDMFSKCSRLEYSIRLFQETPKWDIALCNSMISAYVKNGFGEEALKLFAMACRENFKPTESTVGSILSCVSCLVLGEQGMCIHSLVIKLGLEFDVIVSSLLLDMYSKYGLITSAFKIFNQLNAKDLVFWNIMIMGCARNGMEIEALRIFEDLCEKGPLPDRITLNGVLLACSNGGLINEGKHFFTAMEKTYGITRGIEHYKYMVDMMGRAGKLEEAMDFIESMPYEPSASIWVILLEFCRIHGNVKISENVAKQMMELEPYSPLPYIVLISRYGSRGMWERMTKVRKAMKEKGVRKVRGYSWIGIKNKVFVFYANHIEHCGGETLLLMLELLNWEMEKEGYVSEQYAMVGDGGEE